MIFLLIRMFKQRCFYSKEKGEIIMEKELCSKALKIVASATPGGALSRITPAIPNIIKFNAKKITKPVPRFNRLKSAPVPVWPSNM